MANRFNISLEPTSEGSTMLKISPHGRSEVVDGGNLLLLIPCFLEDRRQAGVKANTLAAYQFQLAGFCDWWTERGPHFENQLTVQSLRDYPAWLKQQTVQRSDKPLTKSTIETMTRRARTYLRWLYDHGHVPLDISQWLPKMPKQRTKTRSLNEEQILAVLNACRGGQRIRNLAILTFLLETGCRVMEASNATWSNVHFENGFRGWVWLEETKTYLDFDKRRHVCFGEATGKLLQLWSVYREPNGDDRLFGMSTNGIQQAMGRISDKSQVKFTAHDLRRTFSTYWIRHAKGPNPALAERLLEVQLGHSPRTVTQQHYLVLTHLDVFDAYTSPFESVEIPGLTSKPGG